MLTQQRAVFLDRDGVLNRAMVRNNLPYPPRDFNELEIISDVPEALQRLRTLGLLLLVVTNQPDVARGTQTREKVEEINKILSDRLKLDAVYTCYHDTGDGCACRKPLPGMLRQGAEEWQLDLSQCFMIGDRSKDIEAGLAAGCTTLLVQSHYAEEEKVKPHYRINSLSQAADMIEQIIKGEK